MLISGFLIFGITSLNAQSRKEMIELLIHKTDSLNQLLKDKNEALKKAEIKLAKMEGAAEAKQVFSNQYQGKTDSLSKSLSEKDSIINNLNTELTQLKASIYELQESKKDIIGKNEQLQAELNTYKQNAVPVPTVKKETKVMEPNAVATETKQQPVKTVAPK